MQHSKFCPKVRVLHHRFGRDYEIERWQLKCWLQKNDLFFRSLLTLKPSEVCVVCFERKNYSSNLVKFVFQVVASCGRADSRAAGKSQKLHLLDDLAG